jgi:hypothetical protein
MIACRAISHVLYLQEKTAVTDEEKKGTERKKLGMSNDEVVAVLGHELGHWALYHTLINLIITEVSALLLTLSSLIIAACFQLNLLFMLSVFGYFYQQKNLYVAFGFDTQPTIIGLLIVFQFILSPYNEVQPSLPKTLYLCFLRIPLLSKLVVAFVLFASKVRSSGADVFDDVDDASLRIRRRSLLSRLGLRASDADGADQVGQGQLVATRRRLALFHMESQPSTHSRTRRSYEEVRIGCHLRPTILLLRRSSLFPASTRCSLYYWMCLTMVFST